MDKIERATIGWFDATPVGRYARRQTHSRYLPSSKHCSSSLLSRFAKDLQLVDTQLPQTIDQTLNFLSNLLGIFAQLAIGNQYLLIVVVVVMIIYLILFGYFRKTSIEIQRLEAISRAPIISHLTQSLEGAATIRSFRLEKAFMVACMNRIDNNTVDYFSLRYCFAYVDLLWSIWPGLLTILLVGSVFVWIGVVLQWLLPPTWLSSWLVYCHHPHWTSPSLRWPWVLPHQLPSCSPQYHKTLSNLKQEWTQSNV